MPANKKTVKNRRHRSSKRNHTKKGGAFWSTPKIDEDIYAGLCNYIYNAVISIVKEWVNEYKIVTQTMLATSSSEPSKNVNTNTLMSDYAALYKSYTPGSYLHGGARSKSTIRVSVMQQFIDDKVREIVYEHIHKSAANAERQLSEQFKCMSQENILGWTSFTIDSPDNAASYVRQICPKSTSFDFGSKLITYLQQQELERYIIKKIHETVKYQDVSRIIVAVVAKRISQYEILYRKDRGYIPCLSKTKVESYNETEELRARQAEILQLELIDELRGATDENIVTKLRAAIIQADKDLIEAAFAIRNYQLIYSAVINLMSILTELGDTSSPLYIKSKTLGDVLNSYDTMKNNQIYLQQLDIALHKFFEEIKVIPGLFS